VIAGLLKNAGGMSDEDILIDLNKHTLRELSLSKIELRERRQNLRRMFGHTNSPFLRDSSGSREYETLVRVTDLVTVAISRKQFEPLTALQAPALKIPRGGGRKRGPKTDYENAKQVAKIIARVAPDGDWRSKLDDVGEALDHGVCDLSGAKPCDLEHETIPVPRGWQKKKCDWLVPPDRATMVKAIEYRLEIARKKRPSETPS